MASRDDQTVLALAKVVRDLTRQVGAMALRIEALEKRLGAPARPKTQKLSREEWLARKREAIRVAAEHRWAKAKRTDAKRPKPTRPVSAPPAGKRRSRRGKGRPR